MQDEEVTSFKLPISKFIINYYLNRPISTEKIWIDDIDKCFCVDDICGSM